MSNLSIFDVATEFLKYFQFWRHVGFRFLLRNTWLLRFFFHLFLVDDFAIASLRFQTKMRKRLGVKWIVRNKMVRGVMTSLEDETGRLILAEKRTRPRRRMLPLHHTSQYFCIDACTNAYLRLCTSGTSFELQTGTITCTQWRAGAWLDVTMRNLESEREVEEKRIQTSCTYVCCWPRLPSSRGQISQVFSSPPPAPRCTFQSHAQVRWESRCFAVHLAWKSCSSLDKPQAITT